MTVTAQATKSHIVTQYVELANKRKAVGVSEQERALLIDLNARLTRIERYLARQAYGESVCEYHNYLRTITDQGYWAMLNEIENPLKGGGGE